MAKSETRSAFAFRASSGEVLIPADRNPSSPDASEASALSLAPVQQMVPEEEFLLAVIAPDIPIYGRGKMRKLRP